MPAPLPPHVQAYVDALVAAAPPLSEHQKRAIQRNLGPYVLPAPREQDAQAA